MVGYLKPVIAGIQLRFTWGWLVVVTTLAAITIYTVIPRDLDHTGQVVWTAAVALVVLGGLASLLVHEWAHIRVARHNCGSIPVVEPAIIGALPDTLYDPESPEKEARVALAGPVASLVLAGLLGILWYVLSGFSTPLVPAIGILALVNGALGLLNLMPGYPFDGGRLFRAFIWYLNGNLITATRVAAIYGYVLVMVGMAGGVLMISIGKTTAIWGTWTLLTSWMINKTIGAGASQVLWVETSKRLKVDDVFVGGGRRLQASTTIDAAIERLLEAYGHGPTLVVEDGEAVGIVDLRCVRNIPRSAWVEQTVGDVMLPLESHPRVSGDDPMNELVGLLPEGSSEIVLIERRGRIIAAVDRTLVIQRLQEYIQAEHIENIRRGA